MSTSPGDREPRDAPHLAVGRGERRLLARIRTLWETADPVPADLVERVRFSVALAGLEAEVARLSGDAELSQFLEQADGAALARGATEESRTITFDSSELTIMIRIDSNPDGTARVDGWLAPPRRCQVEIAQVGESETVDADIDGRFAFATVPRGTVRLVVRRPAPAAAGAARDVKTVITPALVL